LVPLSDNPKSVADFGITHAFIKEVEKQIYEALNIISGLIKDGNTAANKSKSIRF
jgi:hypothetical protein